MSIKERIDQDFITAFKAKDELAILLFRQLKSSIAAAEIAKNRQEMTDDEVVKLLKTEVKKRKESAELYRNGGRPELADKEESEIALIKKYLPAELSEEEVSAKVAEVIVAVGATGPHDMGKVIPAAMQALGQSADGATVSRIVKEQLAIKQ